MRRVPCRGIGLGALLRAWVEPQSDHCYILGPIVASVSFADDASFAVDAPQPQLGHVCENKASDIGGELLDLE